MGPWPLPTINTALLLTSGVTLTIAHHALIAGHRAQDHRAGCGSRSLLGVTFLGLQAYEYHHAYTELNLKLTSGIYGSTFFMLTGFHGFHVFVGMLMLLFITLRLMKGHFTPQRHFGFEGAAWYWHFVDVVWLRPVHPGLLAVDPAAANRKGRLAGRPFLCRWSGTDRDAVGSHPAHAPGHQHDDGTARSTRPPAAASARAMWRSGGFVGSTSRRRIMKTPALASAPSTATIMTTIRAFIGADYPRLPPWPAC